MVRNDFAKHIKQPNTIVIAVLVLGLMIITYMYPPLADSQSIADFLDPNKDQEFFAIAGRVCMFLLYTLLIILLINYGYYGILMLNRQNFYTDNQREDLIEALRDPNARADINVFRQKTKNLTHGQNILSEIIASILPNALRQQFMLEQYFKTKIENYMNRYSGPVNTITMVSNLGPIVGFLGTLVGLISAFAVSSVAVKKEGKMTAESFSDLQYALMVAIMTSVFGVLIKVFGSIIRSALLSKINKITDEIAEVPIESMYE